MLARALAGSEDALLLTLLGDTRLAASDPAAAAEAYARAAAADPADGRARLMAGWCWLEAGRPAEARPWLEDAARFADQAATARGLLERLPTP